MKTNNELIAEFMSGTFEKEEIMTYGGKRNGKWTFPDRRWCYDDQLQYDTSWDWLMPVVEKIEKLEHIPNNGVFYNITARMEWAKVLTITIDAPIIAVYKAVVEFIKWYNDQKK